MAIVFDSTAPVQINPAFGRGVLRWLPSDPLPATVADIEAASQLMGELSDDRDRLELSDLGRMRFEEDYAVDPDDDDRIEELARHFLEEERFDPSEEDLDGWDAAPDADTLAGQAEAQELAEMGIDPINRGFALDRFGHDCTAPKPRRPIREECIDVVQRETWRVSGRMITRAEAARRYDEMHRATFNRR